MVIIFFQECRDTVSQACEFLETLKYSSHHCETPKLTEIVAARAQLSNLRLLNYPITVTLYRPIISITELFNPRDAPTPEHTNLQHWFFRKLFLKKQHLFQLRLFL